MSISQIQGCSKPWHRERTLSPGSQNALPRAALARVPLGWGSSRSNQSMLCTEKMAEFRSRPVLHLQPAPLSENLHSKVTELHLIRFDSKQIGSCNRNTHCQLLEAIRSFPNHLRWPVSRRILVTLNLAKVALRSFVHVPRTWTSPRIHI